MLAYAARASTAGQSTCFASFFRITISRSSERRLMRDLDLSQTAEEGNEHSSRRLFLANSKHVLQQKCVRCSTPKRYLAILYCNETACLASVEHRSQSKTRVGHSNSLPKTPDSHRSRVIHCEFHPPLDDSFCRPRCLRAELAFPCRRSRGLAMSLQGALEATRQ
jgi:hypothetical protein